MAGLDARQQNTVDQVRILWPYLNMVQRWDWVKRLQPWFDNDWVATVKALAP